MRGLPVFEWKITEIGCGENERGVSAALWVILGGGQAWVPDFIGTAETKKPQVERSGAFLVFGGLGWCWEGVERGFGLGCLGLPPPFSP